ncbi:acyl-CoA thioesterase [Litorimonas taeanensis]|uniref:Acyl-CoA thioesterase n=1 Tax=Litorimonas taeanensis TaxID=568099 RepID=A0A420WFC3_9PROT|nr:thioesterase family protein [Litorimonas taeanensis]RKQ69672.1 acyl-CoA thioesterase [Litorimonas taeanensis]
MPVKDTDKPLGFRDIAESLTLTSEGWKAEICEGWKQGRTVYGGLSAALALEAVFRNHSDLPPLRSANIGFIGPVTDNPVYKTEVLRQGRNVVTIEAKGYVDEAVVITVTFAFGASRESILDVNCPMPEAKSPALYEAYTPEQIRAFVPNFFHNFDTRLVEGSRPVTGADKGYIRTWSRHFDTASREGISSLFCIADVLPPAAMPVLTQPGPVSSMTWMFNVLSDNPETEDGWWQIESDLTAAKNGYSSQIMRIWNSQGELVVEGVQSVTVFV